MKRNTQHMLHGGALVAFALAVLSASAAVAHQTPGNPIDIREFSREADLIFKGTVVDVQYRESEPAPLVDPTTGRPVLDEEGQPEKEDASSLPHTFVTYQVERVYKGRAPGGSVTLRFMGGVADALYEDVDDAGNVDRGPIYVDVSTAPRFDIGDRDLLFVVDNTEAECPLAACEHGRFRLLPLGSSRNGSGVFTEDGFEVVRVTPGSWDFLGLFSYAAWGRYRPSHETKSHTILPGLEVTREDTLANPSEDEAPVDPDRPKGAQFTEAFFDRFVILNVVFSNRLKDLLRAPAIRNADPRQPFYGAVATPDDLGEPREEPYVPAERPWLADLTPAQREVLAREEAEESAQFEANDGNPVIAAPVR